MILIALPVGALTIFLSILWVAWFPRNAKEIVWAKIRRQDICIKCTDTGNLVFKRGKAEGPGVFRSGRDDVIDLIPRDPEPWVNKMFTGDKIRFIIGYIGKSVSTGFEALAVLTAHELLQNHKNKLNEMLLAEKNKPENLGKSELEMQEVYEDYVKKNPHARDLFEKIKNFSVNVPAKIKSKTKQLVREVAILEDARILQTYFTNTADPSQMQHVKSTAYNKGYRDGSNPAGKFKLIFVLIIIIAAVAGVAMLILGLGSGGAAPAK